MPGNTHLTNAKEILEIRVDEITGISMGLDIFPRRNWFSWNNKPVEATLAHPYRDGFKVGVLYVAVFCGLPLLVRYAGVASWAKVPQLYAFQLYGAFWAGWATATTKLAAASTARLIKTDIIPFLSDPTAQRIADDLRLFNRPGPLAVSLVIGLAAAVLGAVLMHVDLGGEAPWTEMIFWAAGWWILFTTSANVVINGQYYAAFSRNVVMDSDKLFAPEPSNSSLILNLASLGQIMLLFWFGIAISIALIFPIAMTDWSHFGFNNSLQNSTDPPFGRFVLTDVMATGFFSIGLGTIVFLTHEAGIRRAIRACVSDTLRSIEAATADLLASGASLSDDDEKSLAALSARHADVAASGSYRSAIISGVSLCIPLIPPLASELTKLWPPT